MGRKFLGVAPSASADLARMADLWSAGFIDARAYGVALDCRGVYDAVVSAGTLSTVTSATAAFTAADNGKVYTLASTAGAVTTGTLTYVNATTCTMSTAAGGAMTGARLIFGTDDTTAWQNALNAATKGQTVDCSGFTWRSLCTGTLNVPAGVTLGLTGRGPFDPQTNPAMNDWGPTFVVRQDNTTAFITLNTGSGLGDFILYSANQVPPTATTPTTFKALIDIPATTAGVHIGRPYLANAFSGITIAGGRHVIDCPQIGALVQSVAIDHSLDTVSIRRIQCSPYWRLCEGMSYGPTASSLDAYALNNAWALTVQRADSFWVDQLFTFGLYGGLALIDSADTGISPRCGYGRVGMMDIDQAAYGVLANATQAPGVLIGSLHNAGNNTGVGTAGQWGAITNAGGTLAPKIVVKSWSLWGTHVGNSSNGAGTLIVPGTNPG